MHKRLTIDNDRCNMLMSVSAQSALYEWSEEKNAKKREIIEKFHCSGCGGKIFMNVCTTYERTIRTTNDIHVVVFIARDQSVAGDTVVFAFGQNGFLWLIDFKLTIK